MLSINWNGRDNWKNFKSPFVDRHPESILFTAPFCYSQKTIENDSYLLGLNLTLFWLCPLFPRSIPSSWGGYEGDSRNQRGSEGLGYWRFKCQYLWRKSKSIEGVTTCLFRGVLYKLLFCVMKWNCLGPFTLPGSSCFHPKGRYPFFHFWQLWELLWGSM